jgi:hypothetical protein
MTELMQAVAHAVGGAKTAAPGRRRKALLTIASDGVTDALNPGLENEDVFAYVEAGIPAPPGGGGSCASRCGDAMRNGAVKKAVAEAKQKHPAEPAAGRGAIQQRQDALQRRIAAPKNPDP